VPGRVAALRSLFAAPGSGIILRPESRESMSPRSDPRRYPALPVFDPGGPTDPRPAADPDAARLAVLTLGCDKNTVDSERLLGRLAGAGARVVPPEDGADVLVINTCGFIDAAKEESIDAILEAVRAKERGEVRAVVAVGCLVQRYRDELAREIPEVDVFLGLTEVDRLLPELRMRGLLPPSAAVSLMERPLRLLATATLHTSYLKISEGCDHGCAFCAIPLMRGKHRSTPVAVLVAEARELAARGVVELNLISQDSTWYGRDRSRAARLGVAVRDDGSYFVGRPYPGMRGAPREADPRPNGAVPGRAALLPDLLQALLAATDIPWLRLFYMYPSGITRELVELLAREPRLVPYLDLPIQHGSDRVLRLMRRPERRATIVERVGWLRTAIPDVTLRTTVIVGFPGETEDDFESLLELLEEVRFDRVGAFAYSLEEGTAAAAMPDRVSEPVRRERLARLLELQAAISLEKNQAQVGREVSVLVDGMGSAGGVARTAGQAAEVDGVVHLPWLPEVRAGTFIRARITEALEHDLVAEHVEEEVVA
jgi:ribosomal protein S12 methylthiotransferase